jgi:hypothetical protein
MLSHCVLVPTPGSRVLNGDVNIGQRATENPMMDEREPMTPEEILQAALA